MLACSTAIAREQDLLAVDELGRIHIFELKKDNADAASVYQLVSYLVGRPRDDEQWVRRSIASTLWYGELAIACRLAGLVARQSVEKLRTPMSRRVAGRPVAQIALLEAKLEKLAQLASERASLDLEPATFCNIARSLLVRGFGTNWSGPLDNPEQVLNSVAEAKFPSHWKVGRTEPGIIIWIVAPNVNAALDAPQPLLERNLEIRCVSIDVRENVPGREWSITTTVSESHAQHWPMADVFAGWAQRVVGRHLDECPATADRVFVWFRAASDCWATGKGWAAIGWRAAGGARVYFDVTEDTVSHYLLNHGWTQGASLRLRDPILKLCKDLRKRHPSSWAWSPHKPEAACNMEFVEGAVHLLNDYCRGLERIGAFEVDEWGYWMPAG
jgi:hypothetical protein